MNLSLFLKHNYLVSSKKLVKLHVRMLWAPRARALQRYSPLLIDTMQSSHVGRAGSSDAVDRPAQLYISSTLLAAPAAFRGNWSSWDGAPP